LSKQTKLAKQTHTDAQKNGQTCIDCHKGIVHFLPEAHGDQNAQKSSAVQGGTLSDGSAIFATEMMKATNDKGNEVRLMPYAELMQWKVNGDQVQGTLHGWQQVGAEAVVYQELGKRIMLALLDEDARNHVQVLKTVHDAVTDSDWKEINVAVNVKKEKMTSDLAALNQYGSQLNQTQCSSCHAAISADHYTANQWIGVVNSMKDRTSMNKDEVRALTIYLQRNAKDMAKK
ncbi:NapC/NirT family cytochrome c, partial [Haemophilus influenzae]